MCIENQNSEQNRFLKVLAYKSIDTKAISQEKLTVSWPGRGQTVTKYYGTFCGTK